MLRKILLLVSIFLMPIQLLALNPKEIESIRAILSEIYKTDQETRQVIAEKTRTLKQDDPELKKLWNKQHEIDLENQRIISKLLDEHGWPEKTEFKSDEPGTTVFLVIQHADIKYQKKHIEIARTATENGNLKSSSFALLQDRMLLRDGKKQIYGSQVKLDPESGDRSFFPIEDEANVDKRRSEVGLGPLSEYAKHFDFEYKPGGG